MSLSYCLAVLSRRGKLLAFMNSAFFGCVFVVVFVSEFLLPPQLYLDLKPSFAETIFGNGFVLMLFGIFAFNLALSSFIIVTLPGFIFFPLSTGFLVFRAFMWGLLLHAQPNWIRLVAMPTLVLEGEAYALAAVAGTTVGTSWLKPKKPESTRFEALREALKECLAIYVFVVMLLFAAAFLEAATLTVLSNTSEAM